jgi:hypothetical protein
LTCCQNLVGDVAVNAECLVTKGRELRDGLPKPCASWAHSATAAPDSARSFVVANPMLMLAPVTIATLP